MLNCKQIVKIVSSEDKPNWRQRLEVRFHLLMCHHCRKYVKHLEFMKTGFKKLFRDNNLQQTDPEKLRSIENKILENLKANKK